MFSKNMMELLWNVKPLEDSEGEDKKEKEVKVVNVFEDKVENPNVVDEEYLVKHKGREIKDKLISALRNIKPSFSIHEHKVPGLHLLEYLHQASLVWAGVLYLAGPARRKRCSSSCLVRREAWGGWCSAWRRRWTWSTPPLGGRRHSVTPMIVIRDLESNDSRRGCRYWGWGWYQW